MSSFRKSKFNWRGINADHRVRFSVMPPSASRTAIGLRAATHIIRAKPPRPTLDTSLQTAPKQPAPPVHVEEDNSDDDWTSIEFAEMKKRSEMAMEGVPLLQSAPVRRAVKPRKKAVKSTPNNRKPQTKPPKISPAANQTTKVSADAPLLWPPELRTSVRRKFPGYGWFEGHITSIEISHATCTWADSSETRHKKGHILACILEAQKQEQQQPHIVHPKQGRKRKTDCAVEKDNEPVDAKVFLVGEEIEADWKNRGKFYPGKIIHRYDNDTYDILYEDDGKETRVPAMCIRKPQATNDKSTRQTRARSRAR